MWGWRGRGGEWDTVRETGVRVEGAGGPESRLAGKRTRGRVLAAGDPAGISEARERVMAGVVLQTSLTQASGNRVGIVQ